MSERGEVEEGVDGHWAIERERERERTQVERKRTPKIG